MVTLYFSMSLYPNEWILKQFIWRRRIETSLDEAQLFPHPSQIDIVLTFWKQRSNKLKCPNVWMKCLKFNLHLGDFVCEYFETPQQFPENNTVGPRVMYRLGYVLFRLRTIELRIFCLGLGSSKILDAYLVSGPARARQSLIWSRTLRIYGGRETSNNSWNRV